MIRKIANGIGAIAVICSIWGILAGIAICADTKKNPIGSAPISYVVVKPGDSMESLYSKEGWAEKDIRAYGPTNNRIYPGEIVRIPQVGRPYELGNTGRNAYLTREEAEKAD
ncbi:MAG: LysM peptidoglycan-binding domain-containing protein [Candidatus Pacearchaeota archaeon]